METATPETTPAAVTPFNFAKVESLRKHMLLTTTQMSKLFGVSRVTYYAWLSNRPMRKSHEDNVRRVLKKLLGVLADHGWPSNEVVTMSNTKRMEHLQSLIGDDNLQDIEDLRNS